MPKRRWTIPPEIEADLTPRVRKYIHDLFEAFERELAALEQRINDLEKAAEKLVKPTPKNSSLPPSSQHPHAKVPPKKKRRSAKRRGAQPGHKRAVRLLIPSAECDQELPIVPTACRHCQQPLQGQDPEPLRHQVFELPEIKPVVTEYQLHRLACGCCGTSTCAKLPVGVPISQCGPRLAAFTGLLLVHFRQSRRRAAAFLGDLLKVACSTGWIVKIQNHVGGALAQPYRELQQELSEQSYLCVDESPTKQEKQKAWLWVAVATSFAVFGIFLNRKRESLQALIGDYSKLVLSCDRAKMYFDAKRVQWCWAHLARDLQQLMDQPCGQTRRLGQDLMRQLREMFEHWHSYKAGEKTWHSFQCSVAPIRKQFHSLLVRGLFSGNAKLIGFCRELHAHRDWLWTFTKVQGIEPTNNAAERALRPAVIHRKLSFGTQSAAGSRFLERMLTAVETCRMQGRSPLEFLTSTMEAHYRQTPPPSLMPSTAASARNDVHKVA